MQKLFSGIQILLLISLVSCNDVNRKKSLEGLEAGVLQFYSQSKWGRGNLAKEYVVPALRIKFLDDLDLLMKKVKVSEIDIVRITPIDNNKKAVVRVRITWIPDGEGIVRETLVEDTWINIKNLWLREKSKIVDGKPLPYIFK